MPGYRVTHVLHRTSGLPEDDVVNTLHFWKSGAPATPAEASDLAGYVAASFYDATSPTGGIELEEYLSPEVSRVTLPTIYVHPVLGGSPIAVETALGVRAAVDGVGLPSEAAVCLSFRGDMTNVPEEAVDDGDADAAPERPASRHRGRIYFGPLGVSATTGATGVPAPYLREGLLDLATRLGQVNLQPGLGAFVWGIYSREDLVLWPTFEAWVDNEFDTQRRRGQKATAREWRTI